MYTTVPVVGPFEEHDVFPLQSTVTPDDPSWVHLGTPRAKPKATAKTNKTTVTGIGAEIGETTPTQPSTMSSGLMPFVLHRVQLFEGGAVSSGEAIGRPIGLDKLALYNTPIDRRSRRVQGQCKNHARVPNQLPSSHPTAFQ
ncbi:hypothetical protein SIIN_1299_T [Serendipita indica DSM 11827]|nr:hypothetical protein SIIN_1299_T [Serendipita indica DSM 11827]